MEWPISGTYYDSCNFYGSSVPAASLTGGWWNVGFYYQNNWDDDYVGWPTDAVTYYRMNFRPPCSAQVPQGMYIAIQGQTGSSTQYASGYVGESIPNYADAASARDGQVSYTQWP